jgi:hypothetical protein
MPTPFSRKRPAALLVRLSRRVNITPAAAAYRAVRGRPGLRRPVGTSTHTHSAARARRGSQCYASRRAHRSRRLRGGEASPAMPDHGQGEDEVQGGQGQHEHQRAERQSDALDDVGERHLTCLRSQAATARSAEEEVNARCSSKSCLVCRQW